MLGSPSPDVRGSSVLSNWLPFLFYALFAAAIPATMVAMSFILPRRPVSRTKQRMLPFESVRANFVGAARQGLGAQLTWLDGEEHGAPGLVLDVLLPLAEEGLAAAGVDDDDARRYLDVIERRVHSGNTGGRWMLNSLNAMRNQGTAGQRLSDADIQEMLAKSVRLYAERAAERDGTLPAFAPDAATATDVMIAVTAMLKAVNLQVFELGMWQAWSGR